MDITYLNFVYYGSETAPEKWNWNSLPYTYCNRLYYVRGGSAAYTDESGTHTFKKNHLYLFPQTSNYTLSQDSENRLDHLYFDFLCVPLPYSSDITEIDTSGDTVIENAVNLLDYFVCKVPSYKEESKKYQKYIKPVFLMLLDYIQDRYHVEFRPCGPIQDALVYMIEHFSEEITVNDIARYAGYNPKYFIRIFTKMMMVTPYQFLREMRLSKARALINSGSTVAQAAEATGFGYPSSLSNALIRRKRK